MGMFDRMAGTGANGDGITGTVLSEPCPDGVADGRKSERKANRWQDGESARAAGRRSGAAGRKARVGSAYADAPIANGRKRASHQAIEFSDIVVQALSSIVKSAGEMALRYFFRGRNGEIRPAHGIYEHLDSTR